MIMDSVREYKTKVNSKDVILAVCVFVMIYMCGSYNLVLMSGTLIIGVCLICGLVVVLIGKNRMVSRHLLLGTMVLCCNVLITSIITGDSLKDIIIMLAAIVIAMLFVIGIDFKKYCRMYTDIMLVISIFSLVVYVLAIIWPSMIRMFPNAYYRPGHETYNLGLTFVNLQEKLIRNMGIFWEPGAFQTYLVYAILIELLAIKPSRNYAVVIFGICLVTTWSTTAILISLILVLIYIIYKNMNLKLKSVKIVTMLVVFAITAVSLYSVLPYNIQYAALGKIVVYLKSDKSSITSASVRFDSMIYPLKAYLKSPIVGVGYAGLNNSILEAGHTMTTSTPINWFASYGLLFGSICCVGIYRLSKKFYNKSLVVVSLIFIAIMMSIFTEQYLRNISILIFILYGLSQPVKQN